LSSGGKKGKVLRKGLEGFSRLTFSDRDPQDQKTLLGELEGRDSRMV